jgi:CheY-like chemotaxis protein
MALGTNSLTLLCVEDNQTTRLLYKTLLQEEVKELICAEDGEQGFNIFLERSIDIIITDYDMPTLSGIEMIRKIRELNTSIPIIFATAIDDTNIIIEALRLNVNGFVKKPINNNELFNALENASKLLLANRVINESREKKLHELQKKDEYNASQENLAFAKELNILRNDFYYQMVGGQSISLIDFLYQPLDVISGDAYSARRIDAHRTFYLIVDGMGKGLSASLTTMIMTSFVNHIIDKMIEHESFSLDILIKESIDYIKPILLDEEALAVDYILFDHHYNRLHYAKFAMPVFLLQDKSNTIIKLKSNNPPLSKWQETYNVDEYDIKNVDKFLFYSDGIVENSVKDENATYANYIVEDFKNSFTREELKEKIFTQITTPEDDLTLIFINKFDYANSHITQKIFQTSLGDVEAASNWYEELLNEMCEDSKLSYKANVVFTELFMNAYEHGNLAINSATKHQMLDDDTYIDSLLEKEQSCDKNITVDISKITNQTSTYIVTQITDEGVGFNTQILSEIFRNSQTFNGRGVFVSRKNSMGIYYNTEGNSVLYLNKI